MMGFWDAVASAGPYANNLHNYHSIFTGRMLFLMPTQQCQSTEGKGRQLQTEIPWHHFGCEHLRNTWQKFFFCHEQMHIVHTTSRQGGALELKSA